MVQGLTEGQNCNERVAKLVICYIIGRSHNGLQRNNCSSCGGLVLMIHTFGCLI